MAFIPSPQQAAIFQWVESGSGNAFVQAVAGAGKTTTLIEACGKMTGKIAFAAYNKKIAEEIKTRLAQKGIEGIFAGTFHSFGLNAWKFFTGNKYLKVSEWKTSDIMKELNVPKEYHGFVKKLVSLAKQTAIGADRNINDYHAYLALVEHHAMDFDLDKDSDVRTGIEYAIGVLKASNDAGRQLVDFDDMIYLPVLHDIKLFQNDWVLVDEAQDTNEVRRRLAAKMVKPDGRMIWVGDRHQAIYGFTGADSDAVDLIISSFKCAELPLTVTYRCPKEVVSFAQHYVSHIEAHETAPDGLTRAKSMEEFQNDVNVLTQNDAILCRKTAPLIKQAYSLIRQGIGCHVEGRDIGKGLMDLVKKWKRVKTADALLKQIDKWEEAQIKRAHEKKRPMLAEQIADRAETLRIIADGCDTLDCVVQKIEKIFKNSDEEKGSKTLTLSTVHKAKGREWGNVYILGFHEHMPSKMAKLGWEKEQETHLIYVAVTRAQNTLTLVG